MQVKIICQVLAEKLGEFTYTLITGNNKMKKWALSNGNDIFQWDESKETEVNVDGKKSLILRCTKHFDRKF